jgi:hypothetical protein
MQDVRLPHLQALLNFMYQGEATVNQNELPGFLRTAEALRISGLAPKNQANQVSYIVLVIISRYVNLQQQNKLYVVLICIIFAALWRSK